MKALIKHLIANNLKEIVEKSLLNCHVMGLHSIMLLDCPEKRIRLYVADVDHELYGNNDLTSMTLGFHSHHCNLTLECVKGKFMNLVIEPTVKTDSDLINSYFYESAITNGNMNFTLVGVRNFETVSNKIYHPGESVMMAAREIHTVTCPKGVVCAWLVYEGLEDENYVPLTYSNSDMNVKNEKLYQKPTLHQVLQLLIKVELI
jgi:hypothetical protein